MVTNISKISHRNIISKIALALVIAMLLQCVVVIDYAHGEVKTSNLTITIINTSQIELSWNDFLVNEKRYIVERRVDSGSFYVFSYPSTNATVAWDYNLEAGKTYTYRVKVTDSADNTYIYTDEVSIRTDDLMLPTSLTIVPVSYNQIDLKWTYPDQKAYNTIIERRAENDTNWQQISRVGVGQTTYSDKSIASGVRYYYRIRAYLSENIRTKAYPEGGSSAYSLLYKPTNLQGYALPQYQIQLKWQDNSIETAFIIERKSPDEGLFKEIDVVPENTTSYIDYNTEENILYTYRIKAVTGSAESQFSDEVNVASTYLRTPEALKSSYETGTSVRLTWQDLTSGETGFEIWKKAGENGVWELYETMGRNTNSYTDMDVLPQSTYSYKVRAKINDNSVYSDFSKETAIWTSSISAPTDLEYKVIGQNEVELNWKDKSNIEAGFVVERKIGYLGQWYPISNLQQNTTKYNDKWVYSNEINYYRIKTYDNLNAINYSNEIIVTTQKPETPTNLQAHALSSSEVQLSWQDNSVIENEFVIEAKQFYRFIEIGRVSANTTIFTHKDANPERTYIYRVRAVNGSIQGDNSNEANATTKQEVLFTDIAGLEWASDAINNLASRKVFDINNNSKFYPEQTITKGEFCSIIIRSLGLKTVAAGRFADVTSRHKYYDEIMTAAKLGIISKDKYNKIYPDKLITREQAGVILTLALKAKGTPLPETNTSILKQFADYRSISDKSAENLAAVCGAGIFTGRIENGRNYLQASSYITRAESAVMAYKALNHK